MLYITSTFTLGMLQNKEGKIAYKEISLQEARKLVKQEFISAVGHHATAILMSKILGVMVPCNRIQISVSPGDCILVFQLLIRLEEGKVLSVFEMEELWQEGKLSFYKVEVLE